MDGLDDIRHVLTIARRMGLSKVEWENNGLRFEGSLEPCGASRPVTESVLIAAPEDLKPRDETHMVAAPCVGYFKSLSSPASVGDQVESGQVVATISALGIANEVQATVNGEIVEQFVRNDEPVEFGQPLFRVKVKA